MKMAMQKYLALKKHFLYQKPILHWVLPELCKKGLPLTWNKNAQTVNAYIIDGSRTGTAV